MEPTDRAKILNKSEKFHENILEVRNILNIPHKGFSGDALIDFNRKWKNDAELQKKVKTEIIKLLNNFGLSLGWWDAAFTRVVNGRKITAGRDIWLEERKEPPYALKICIGRYENPTALIKWIQKENLGIEVFLKKRFKIKEEGKPTRKLTQLNSMFDIAWLKESLNWTHAQIADYLEISNEQIVKDRYRLYKSYEKFVNKVD